MNNWTKILLLGFVLLFPFSALGDTGGCTTSLSFQDISVEHPVILPQWIDYFPPVGHGVHVASTSETSPKITQKSHHSRSSELAAQSKASTQIRTHSVARGYNLGRKIIFPFHSYI